VTDIDNLLAEGDLSAVRSALVEQVRAQPGDARLRMYLFQFFALIGELDKSLKQLETLAQLSPDAQMLGVTYHQAIVAEKFRAGVFTGELDLLMLLGEGSWAQGIAQGISLLAQGKADEAAAVRDAAFDNAPDTPGTLNGAPFDWIADADSRFGPTFEAVIAGRYGLVPFDQVTKITSDGPEDLRDLIWLPVQIEFKSQQSVAAFLPVRYPGSERSDDGQVVLARLTGWEDEDWGQRGVGQRIWTTSAGEDVGILDLRSLAFD
jgi:type VI secretion system protein ImpE